MNPKNVEEQLRVIRETLEIRPPLVSLITPDIYRAEWLLAELAKMTESELWSYSATQGLMKYEDGLEHQKNLNLGKIGSPAEPPESLRHALHQMSRHNTQRHCIFVLRNPAAFFSKTNQDSNINRERLFDIVHSFRVQKKSLVIVAKDYFPYDEYITGAKHLFLQPPFLEERKAYIENLIKPRLAVSGEWTDRMAAEAGGIERVEIENAVNAGLLRILDGNGDGRIDIMLSAIRDERAKRINSEYLKLEDDGPVKFGKAAGYKILSSHFDALKLYSAPEAAAFGCEFPRGTVIYGPPGVGKTLSVRAAASRLGIPLIAFKLAEIYNSGLGDSERNIRSSLRLIDSAGTCLVLIDEADKCLPNGGKWDCGTSQRILSIFLEWSNDRNSCAHLVLTANDVSAINPALLRCGRFDEIFFMDIPNEKERADIFATILEKKGADQKKLCPDIDPSDFKFSDKDLSRLAVASADFSGAEISEVVNKAFREKWKCSLGKERPTAEDIHCQIRRSMPLSRTPIWRERIDEMRRNVIGKNASLAGDENAPTRIAESKNGHLSEIGMATWLKMPKNINN